MIVTNSALVGGYNATIRLWGGILMMTVMQGYAGRLKGIVTKKLLDPRLHTFARGLGYVLGGFFLAGAALSNRTIPLAMGFLLGCTGWGSVLACLGGCLGYWVFWGSAGYQGILWCVAALAVQLWVKRQSAWQTTPLLLPAVAGLMVSAAGVTFQIWLADSTPVWFYLLRVVLGALSSCLFYQVLRRRNPVLDWLAMGLGVLALAQVMPIKGLNLGILAAACITVTGAFPGAMLAGLALDLAGITPVPMTAVFCGGYLIRFLPKGKPYITGLFPGGVYILVMVLTKTYDLTGLPALVLGGLAGVFLPMPAKVPARRGETGVAQVRLEMAAGALLRSQQLLLEYNQGPPDEDALIRLAAERACSGCPLRSSCKDTLRLCKLPTALLHKPLLSPQELPIVCRKSGRFLAELHRQQEHYRSILADRARQEEYRQAVLQQYRFLAEFLQDLSDTLAEPAKPVGAAYHAEVEVFGNRPREENGDRCAVFAGTACRHYVILCDGMGTGIGAVQEARTALQLLQRLLTAGYPAQAAIASLNSICALRSRAGAVTVDLLELELDTGRARLFKWGAAPSYLLCKTGAEKIGTAGPPPGLSLVGTSETVYRLSLRRGERLVMVSDGVGEEEALHCCQLDPDMPSRQLAERLLERGMLSGSDDATVVVCTIRNA